ncbi:MAG: hypothetical protein ACYCSQ_04755 [bacterium]
MIYYGIKDKKTGQLLQQYFDRNTKRNISVLSLNYVADSLSSHIFLTKDRNAVMAILCDGYYQYNNEAYKLDCPKDDLEIYETEFNL